METTSTTARTSPAKRSIRTSLPNPNRPKAARKTVAAPINGKPRQSARVVAQPPHASSAPPASNETAATRRRQSSARSSSCRAHGLSPFSMASAASRPSTPNTPRNDRDCQRECASFEVLRASARSIVEPLFGFVAPVQPSIEGSNANANGEGGRVGESAVGLSVLPVR